VGAMKRIFLIAVILTLSIQIFSQSDTIEQCKIWKKFTICNFISDSLYMDYSVVCLSGTCHFFKCKGDNKKNLVGVQIDNNLLCKSSSNLSFQRKFKNIRLIINGTKKVIHPIGVLVYDPDSLNYHSTKAYQIFLTFGKLFTVHFSKEHKPVLILIFRHAEVGDKIYIDDFYKAEITD
jgi:hypothetical protein